jgi:large subunit ribosomal protein L30
MTETKTTAAKKKTAAPAKKAAPAKAEAPAKKAAPAKKVAKEKSGKTLVVVQYASAAGTKPGMKETLAGLGLGKVRARRELEDTPAVRGMIRKVGHLVMVEGE